MPSRFAPNFPILNGPHGGDRCDAPPGTTVGSAVGLPWAGPKGMQYAVYVLVQIPDELAGPPAPVVTPEGEAAGPLAQREKRLGLAFVRAWPTAREAQQHVREIALVATVAREAAQSN